MVTDVLGDAVGARLDCARATATTPRRSRPRRRTRRARARRAARPRTARRRRGSTIPRAQQPDLAGAPPGSPQLHLGPRHLGRPLVSRRSACHSGPAPRGSPPRYAATAAGSRRTSSALPRLTTRPVSITTTCAQSENTSGTSCSTSRIVGAGDLVDAPEQRRERLRLTLRDAGGRLVEQERRAARRARWTRGRRRDGCRSRAPRSGAARSAPARTRR